MDNPTTPGIVIVALDGTRASERVLAPARAVARIYGSTLVLVRALHREALPAEDDPSTAPSVSMFAGPAASSTSGITLPSVGPMPGEELVPARPIENPDAAGYLNILDNELEAEGFTVEHVDPDEDPADAILDEARSRGAGLIVMGTHQRKGLDRLFKGSIAAKVLRASPCPVLVVPLD